MAPPLDVVAIALAYEGVPLCAIARATEIPSETLRERLRVAQMTGLLIELPRDDWPPGVPRDQRALQLSHLVHKSRPELSATVACVFRLCPVEASLLLDMLQHNLMRKDRVRGMSRNSVDVHICRMRRQLEPHRIAIETIWGVGYRIPAGDRQRAMGLILQAAEGDVIGRSQVAPACRGRSYRGRPILRAPG
jgi:hypothetical protein